MKKVRWGVIGATGFAQHRTIPEGILVAANAELTAVMARDAGRLRRIAQQFSDVFQTTHLEELCARDDVDAIYIATPTVEHASQALAALRAGKHVLVEKPAAMNGGEAANIRATAQAAKLCLGTAFMMPYHGAHKAMNSLISAGTIGKPVYGRAQCGFWYPPQTGAWRQIPELGGGGSFADVGVHCVNLLEAFFGRTTAVQSQTCNAVHDYASEDSSIVLLEFEGGALGIVEAFFNLPDRSLSNALQIYGSEGSLCATGTIGQESSGEVVLRGDFPPSKVSYEPVNPYRAEIEAFSQVVIEDDWRRLDFSDGIHSVKVMEAVYQSAKTGQRVKIEE